MTTAQYAREVSLIASYLSKHRRWRDKTDLHYVMHWIKVNRVPKAVNPFPDSVLMKIAESHAAAARTLIAHQEQFNAMMAEVRKEARHAA